MRIFASLARISALAASLLGAIGVASAQTIQLPSITLSGDCTGAGPRAITTACYTLTSNGDSNVTIAAGTQMIATSASFTAARTWTLPAASASEAGRPLIIADKIGGVSATNTLTVLAAGSDLINGTTSATLASAFAGLAVASDGVSRWTIIGSVQPSGSVPLNPQSSSTYAIISTDLTKEIIRSASSAQTDTVPPATGAMGAGGAFALQTTTNADTITPTSGLVNGLTVLKLGARQYSGWTSDGVGWNVALGVPQPATQNGTTFLSDDMSYKTLQGNIGIEIDFFYSGVPTASAILSKTFSRQTVVSASAPIKCSAITGATSSATVTLNHVVSGTPTSIGTLVFGASGSAYQGCTVTFSSGVTFAVGDALTVTFPGTPDVTLGNVALSIPATQ